MPTGLVQRPRSGYIYLFLVIYGPGAAVEKEEIYIPPPCLEISYVLTMLAYENGSYISHCPAHSSHTHAFVFSPSSQ